MPCSWHQWLRELLCKPWTCPGVPRWRCRTLASHSSSYIFSRAIAVNLHVLAQQHQEGLHSTCEPWGRAAHHPYPPPGLCIRYHEHTLVSLRLNSRQVLSGSGPKWLIFKWLLRADVPMCIPSFLLLTHFLHKQQIALLLSFWSAGGGGKSHTNDISSLFRQAGDGGYGHVPPSHLSLPRCFFWDFLL